MLKIYVDDGFFLFLGEGGGKCSKTELDYLHQNGALTHQKNVFFLHNLCLCVWSPSYFESEYLAAIRYTVPNSRAVIFLIHFFPFRFFGFSFFGRREGSFVRYIIVSIYMFSLDYLDRIARRIAISKQTGK